MRLLSGLAAGPVAPSRQPTSPVRPLRQLVVRGAFWTIGGYGATQVLRLASNLVLARLLFPEAFGLLALAGMFIQGLQMFSDLGLRPSIIQSKRGDDPDFLNTAWTLQIIRGAGLWVCSCLIAWPAAMVYGEPQLVHLVPACGLVALVMAFDSTAMLTRSRHLALGRLMFLELGSQVVGFGASVAFAVAYRSVWAFVVGGIVGTMFRTALSHIVLGGIRNRLQWDREASRELLHFGKWILLSTMMMFMTQQGDRMLLGRYLSLGMLGVYSLAFALADALTQVVSTLSHRVVYPALSKVARDDRNGLEHVYRQVRRRLDVLVLPLAGILMVAGDHVIALLYDARYAEAGWILRVLALRVALNCTLPGASVCLMAIGRLQYGTIAIVAKGLWLAAGIPLGFYLYGLAGAVWAVALSDAAMVPPLWWGMKRHGLFSAAQEAMAVAWLAIGVGVGAVVVLLVP